MTILSYPLPESHIVGARNLIGRRSGGYSLGNIKQIQFWRSDGHVRLCAMCWVCEKGFFSRHKLGGGCCPFLFPCPFVLRTGWKLVFRGIGERLVKRSLQRGGQTFFLKRDVKSKLLEMSLALGVEPLVQLVGIPNGSKIARRHIRLRDASAQD